MLSSSILSFDRKLITIEKVTLDLLKKETKLFVNVK